MDDLKARMEGFDDDQCWPENENALYRVANLPIVNSTWNFMHSYYSNVKQTYPKVTPYLEVAENITSTAASIALTTSKPVVDKYGPTFNVYANKGLDKIEDKVPIILKHPQEIYDQTKDTASGLLLAPVDNALATTEKYVDYYLPSDDSDTCEESDEDDEEESCEPMAKATSDRIRDISAKVRKRSYEQAMNCWQGIHVRSQEALSRLNFTVDLIQYAQTGLATTSAGLQHSASLANETISGSLQSARSNLNSAAGAINHQLEDKVLVHAQKITKQLNESCLLAFQYIRASPQMQHLLRKAVITKETTEELYSTFASKTSISDISASLIASTRIKTKSVEDSLLNILDSLAEQPPVSWLSPDCNVDPLGGILMEEIEAQLYGRPGDHDDDIAQRRPRRRSSSSDRKQG